MSWSFATPASSCQTMLHPLLQASVLLIAAGVLWKYLKQLVLKSPLDNIPGPPFNSFLYGENLVHLSLCHFLSTDIMTGNLKQLISPKYGWGFVEHLTESYPGVACLRGPLGVSPLLHVTVVSDRSAFDSQNRLLYVFDPLAMHHVVVKDAHIFPMPAWVVKYESLARQRFSGSPC